jgi:hypothetical protein
VPAVRRAAFRLVARPSCRLPAVPRVQPIDEPRQRKEPTMTRNLTAQAVSIVLSVLVTVCTLMALDGLATTDHAAQRQAVAAPAARA